MINEELLESNTYKNYKEEIINKEKIIKELESDKKKLQTQIRNHELEKRKEERQIKQILEESNKGRKETITYDNTVTELLKLYEEELQIKNRIYQRINFQLGECDGFYSLIESKLQRLEELITTVGEGQSLSQILQNIRIRIIQFDNQLEELRRNGEI